MKTVRRGGGDTRERIKQQATRLFVERGIDAVSVRDIADAVGIQEYYEEEFAAPTELIAYGAPLVEADRPELLAAVEEAELAPGGYHLVVARFEPENHVDVIVEGYVRSGAELPLVVVGSAPYADEYTDDKAASYYTNNGTGDKAPDAPAGA